MILKNEKPRILTKKQRLAITYLLEGLSKTKTAEKLEVTPRTLHNWLRKPLFHRELLAEREARKDESQAREVVFLSEKVGEARENPRLKVRTMNEYVSVVDKLLDREDRLRLSGKVATEAAPFTLQDLEGVEITSGQKRLEKFTKFCLERAANSTPGARREAIFKLLQEEVDSGAVGQELFDRVKETLENSNSEEDKDHV